MAENKKSFLLYSDLIHTIEKMSDEDSGKLFKHILKYVNDKNPTTDNIVIELVFEQIKQQLKRDLVKYESIRERNRINGKKGGRPKEQEEPKKPTGLSGNPKKPKKADNDNDNDNVSGNDKTKKNIEEREKEFFSSLTPFVETYGKNMIREFYDYWTEPNKSKTKMNFELKKTWDTKRRLVTWSNKDFGTTKKQEPLKLKGKSIEYS